MKRFLKEVFSSKITKIRFDRDNQSFEIDDNWRSQLLFVRIIAATMLFFSVVNLIKTDFSNELFIVTTLIHAPLLFVFLFMISAQSSIKAEEIKNVTIRRGNTNATICLNLKNQKRRTLFVFEAKDIDETLVLFREQNIIIKEKKFLFS